ncbi:helix-turn-helix domain-containing protein [Nonomuraea terrae]|uniref:helix-turn-helix domain-containing protein n=1 Tax=Nonomuraea terrae TaxID=2530383 RepID=UPI0037932F9D
MSEIGVLHPVRIRVIQIVALGPRTGTQLRQALPDVPYSSLYRHIRWLVDADVMRVTGERKVRGAVEHTYELDKDAVQAALPDMPVSAADHGQAMTAFMTGLLAQVHSYLASAPEDPVADGLLYTLAPLWVNEEEVARIHTVMRELVESLRDNGPGPDRRQLMLGVVAIPPPHSTS